ncbi:MAG: FAD-dependent oxidoreductase [Gemmatimonadaceae bacterium]
MTAYHCRVLSNAVVADRTVALQLARPEGFSFTPGQYLDLTILDPTANDEQGPTRSLSIASAPAERELLLVARLRDTAFKRALSGLREGTEVAVDGPFRDLEFPSGGVRPLVFVAGGVGVVPFLSAVRAADLAGHPLPATLFYSNRHPEDAAFLDELGGLAARVSGFRFVATMTRAAESARPWTGETARLGPELFARVLPSLAGPLYYIVGSGGLVSDVRQTLERAGVPRRDIDIELFTGY